MDDPVDVNDGAVAGTVGACRPDWTVTGMVEACRPDRTVEAFERSGYSTDLVCVLTCGTPSGRREAVLKATTADLVPPEIARSEPRLLELVGRKTSVPVPDVYGYVDAQRSTRRRSTGGAGRVPRGRTEIGDFHDRRGT